MVHINHLISAVPTVVVGVVGLLGVVIGVGMLRNEDFRLVFAQDGVVQYLGFERGWFRNELTVFCVSICTCLHKKLEKCTASSLHLL